MTNRYTTLKKGDKVSYCRESGMFGEIGIVEKVLGSTIKVNFKHCILIVSFLDIEPL